MSPYFDHFDIAIEPGRIAPRFFPHELIGNITALGILPLCVPLRFDITDSRQRRKQEIALK